jgi:hypothetical protein
MPKYDIFANIYDISLYSTLVRMRSQIEKSIEEFARKIDVAAHSNQSVIKGYRGMQKIS